MSIFLPQDEPDAQRLGNNLQSLSWMVEFLSAFCLMGGAVVLGTSITKPDSGYDPRMVGVLLGILGAALGFVIGRALGNILRAVGLMTVNIARIEESIHRATKGRNLSAQGMQRAKAATAPEFEVPKFSGEETEDELPAHGR